MCSPRAVRHIPSTNTLALMERVVCMYIYMYDVQCVEGKTVLTLEKWACIYTYVHTLGSIYKYARWIFLPREWYNTEKNDRSRLEISKTKTRTKKKGKRETRDVRARRREGKNIHLINIPMRIHNPWQVHERPVRKKVWAKKESNLMILERHNALGISEFQRVSRR